MEAHTSSDMKTVIWKELRTFASFSRVVTNCLAIDWRHFYYDRRHLRIKSRVAVVFAGEFCMLLGMQEYTMRNKMEPLLSLLPDLNITDVS